MKWPFSFKSKPSPVESKSSISEVQILQPSGHDYAMQNWRAYAKEGYAQNPTIFRCIDLVAKNAASIRPKIKVNGEYLEQHPLLDLLNRPNPITGGQEFRIEAYSWAMLTGNIFTERSVIGGAPRELYHWQPFMMSIDRSKSNIQIPLRYWASKNQSGARKWDVDPISGDSDMMHLAMFNPSPEAGFMGQSPLAGAASAGDQMNASSKWRFNSLKNDMRPAGILATEQPVTSAQRKELTKDMEQNSGWKKAGKFLLLGGGLKFSQLSLSPKDSDWLNGTKLNKQEICEVFGVPTQLIGVESAQTYANFEQARYAFYINTILPLVDLYFGELNRWLVPVFGENIEICYDKSEIDALDYARQEKTKAILNSDVATYNEKREVLGLPPRDEEEADQIFVDPNKLPAGFDVFTEDEMEATQAAKVYQRMGMSKDEAQTKAMDEFYAKKEGCNH